MKFATVQKHLQDWSEPLFEAIVLFTLAVLLSELVRPGLFASLSLPILLCAVALGVVGLLLQSPSRLRSSGLVFLLLIGILWVTSASFVIAALVIATSALAWFTTNFRTYD